MKCDVQNVKDIVFFIKLVDIRRVKPMDAQNVKNGFLLEKVLYLKDLSVLKLTLSL